MPERTDVRLRKAQRRQVEFLPAALEDLVAADHWVRLIWAHIETLDMSPFLADIKATTSAKGRDATDPRILLCLWVVALAEGIGSARRVAELSERDVIYRWICGGVTVNRDLLAQFRSNSRAQLDTLLSNNIAALMKAGVIKLETVAQDGMKVRASAGAASFRREESLGECLEAAKRQVEILSQELLNDDSALTRRDAARKRAADEKLAAVQRALEEMPAVAAVKAKPKNRPKNGKPPSPPRVSTTDPEARVMKMADGGFRPAYNPQFATDVDSGLIVGLHVSNRGTDSQQAEPVIADVMCRLQRPPEKYLLDGGYVTHSNIEALSQMGIELFMPVKNQPRALKRSHVEPPEVGEWRERMDSEQSKELYKKRASTAERVNAELRKMSLTQLSARGLEKVTSSILLVAIAFNLVRALSLSA